MQLGPDISAVVTGGASGLGEATARTLAKQGVRVAVLDRDAQRGGAVSKDIGGIYCHVDVTSGKAVETAFEEARSAHGQERILVNCAGIANAARTVGRDRQSGEPKPYPLGDFEQVVQVNLIGSFRCLSVSALGMIGLDPGADGERGVIINTASVAAQDGQIGQAAYAASKAGVVGMALPIARDLMNDGIRINTLLPGIFETPMLGGLPEEVKAGIGSQVPFPKRLGRPEEFARLVLVIAETVYLNGEAIRLDGAIRLPPK